jgi:hypothetical protein
VKGEKVKKRSKCRNLCQNANFALIPQQTTRCIGSERTFQGEAQWKHQWAKENDWFLLLGLMMDCSGKKADNIDGEGEEGCC